MSDKKQKKNVAKKLKKSTRTIVGIAAALVLIIAIILIIVIIMSMANESMDFFAGIICIIICAAAAFVSGKVLLKVKDSILADRRKETNASRASSYTSESSSAMAADCAPGSEGQFRAYIRNALPYSGYSYGWYYGDAYLDDIGVRVNRSTATVNISGKVRFVCSNMDETIVSNPSGIQSRAQDAINDIASDLVSRAVKGITDFQGQYAGFDNEWSIYAKDLRAEFESR